MNDSKQDRPLTDLLGGLVDDISQLFRKEVRLAQAEVSEKIAQVLAAGQTLAIGVVLAIGAIGVLLAAIVSILATLFVNWGMDPTLAGALAGFIVAIVIGGIGWAMISSALNAVKATNLELKRTTRSLQEDARVVKEKL